MNDVLDTLTLIAVLGLALVWVTAVFCYALFILGVYDE
jgi:Mg2+ and Co2+ transporter CorA